MVTRRNLLLAAGVGAVAIPAVACTPPATPAPPGTYGVTVDRITITPSAVGFPNYLMSGYGYESRRAASVATDLTATCLAIWDGGVPHVMVSLDVLGVPPSVNTAIRARIAEIGVALAPERLMLLASHTHNGPALRERPDPEVLISATPADLAEIDAYTTWFINAVANLVKVTLTQYRPRECRLRHARGTAEFSKNRAGDPLVLSDVPVLSVESPTGEVYATVFGYGTHPVSGGNQTYFDADYPGNARTRIESARGGKALFVLGAAGDQDPIATGGYGPSPTLVGIHGTILSAAALTALGSGAGSFVSGPLSTAYDPSVALPLNVPGTPAEFAELQARYSDRLSLPAPFPVHAAKALAVLGAGTFPTSVPLPVQRWRFGPGGLRLLALGGEVVSRYDGLIRSALGGDLWIAGYANEVPCYVCSNEMAERSTPTYEGGGEGDFPFVAGGTMLNYGWPLRLKGGAGGVEPTLMAAVTALA